MLGDSLAHLLCIVCAVWNIFCTHKELNNTPQTHLFPPGCLQHPEVANDTFYFPHLTLKEHNVICCRGAAVGKESSCTISHDIKPPDMKLNAMKKVF